MEFNKLPEGSSETQKRRTEFESEYEKTAYDAHGLIQLAKERYNKKGNPTVDDALDLHTRQDDDVEELRNAIAIEIKNTPEAAKERYIKRIEDLNLIDELEKKLKLIVDSYEEAVVTAKELDPYIEVPSKEMVIAKILKLEKGNLMKIAKIMGKPKLIIEPEQSFETIIDAMIIKTNRHYDNSQRVFLESGYSEYEYSGRPETVRVSIVDMIQHPPVVPGQEPGQQRNDEQLRICEKYFRDNGMRLISDRQYAIAMQQSLRAYKVAKEKGEINPERHILDYYTESSQKDGTATATYINQEHNSMIKKIAHSCFMLGDVTFSVYTRPDESPLNYRGRGIIEL